MAQNAHTKYSALSGTFIPQPIETATDQIIIVASSANNIVVSATAGTQFTSASLSRNIITMVINGTTYYIPASTTVW